MVLSDYTFALIKPDAVNRMGQILQEVHKRGFIVEDLRMMKWTISMAAEFYAEHRGKPYMRDLVHFTSSAPLVCMLLAYTHVDVDVVRRWRSAIGSTDPTRAEGGTLRAMFGDRSGPVHRNAVHGSDSVSSAVREIRLVRGFASVGPSFGVGAESALVSTALMEEELEGLPDPHESV
jgi:nucleoside-diphosphate kinase